MLYEVITGVDEKIIQAMEAHHEEYPYQTPESIIVQVADSISGGRPGARRDSVENYLKRLKDLENIANSFDGVEKSYARITSYNVCYTKLLRLI